LLPRATLPAALALVAATLAAGLAWAAGLAGPVWFALALAAEGSFGRLLQARVGRVLGGLDRPVAELRVLSLLLARLEAEPFEEARLRALQGSLRSPGGQASAAIARLVAHAARLEAARNQFLAPFAFALLWRPLHAVAVERWRARSGAAVARWLDAVAELEALSSLAGHAFEHPDHAVPELVDPGPGRAALLEAADLRHPLLPGAVPNDVRLGGEGPRLLLVSGSNMSGKSTYLRTVGVGVVLALCGARVPAARLRLTPLQLGATLRIQDSLLAGRSRFYAEIQRLKALVDLAAGAPPLLALLDEILHGTNSHDRRAGAEAVLAALLGRGALGLVTTHDLALTALARGGEVRNAHFEDQVRDGALAFDYRLREGVVGHSNALALMRAVGLEV
ncbi:MAG TPA: DNA mismatch repair protein MutS, partial [Anaeromyxobacteraceae bacterium]|nr:DNA mismatch repair protein MutS [Anaeromyxobacteraceae bacterium]